MMYFNLKEKIIDFKLIITTIFSHLLSKLTMKNKLSLLILSLAAVLNASAACIPAAEEQYMAVDVAIITGNISLRNSLTEKYCFNHPKFYKEVSKVQGKLFQGVFKSRYVDDLKIFYPTGTPISVFSEGNYARDLLSFAVSAYHMPRINEAEAKIVEKYLPKGEKLNLNPKPLTTKEHDELMSYIVKAYNREGYTFTNKSDGNNMFHYVILANNPKVLYELTNNVIYRNLYLYKKNFSGVTPIHLAFSKKRPYNEATQKEDTPALNSVLINLLTKERVKFVSYVEIGTPLLNFFEFAEIMKDENPDFYKKLKEKFNFNVNISNEKIAQLKPILAKSLILQNVIDSYKDLP